MRLIKPLLWLSAAGLLSCSWINTGGSAGETLLDSDVTVPGEQGYYDFVSITFDNTVAGTWVRVDLSSETVEELNAQIYGPGLCWLGMPSYYGLRGFNNSGHVRLDQTGTHQLDIFGVTVNDATAHVIVTAVSEAELPFDADTTCVVSEGTCTCTAVCNCDPPQDTGGR